MKKIISFAKLDFYTILPYIIYVLAFMAIGLVFGIASKSISVVVSFFSSVTVMLTSYLFSVSEKNKLDTLYSILPISRKIVVAGRYLFTVMYLLLYSVFLFGVLLFMNNAFDFQIVALTLILFGLVIIMVSFQFPIFFILGYNKARLIGFLPMIVVIAVANLALYQSGNFDTIAELSSGILFPLLFVLVSFIILGLSYIASFKMYERKDI